MNLHLILHLRDTRDTLQTVETIAQALNIEAGEYRGREWVRVEHISKRREAINA